HGPAAFLKLVPRLCKHFAFLPLLFWPLRLLPGEQDFTLGPKTPPIGSYDPTSKTLESQTFRQTDDLVADVYLPTPPPRWIGDSILTEELTLTWVESNTREQLSDFFLTFRPERMI